MRKVIIGIMAVAMLAIIPAAASADVARCEVSVPVSTVIKTATFTTTTPSGAGGVWTTAFTVTVNPETNTFAGVGTTTGHDYDGDKTLAEQVTGTFKDSNADGTVDTVSFKSDRPQPLYTDTWSLTDAPMDGVTDSIATVNVNWTVAVKVFAPVITTSTTTTPGTESVKNHGQFVKAQGGGKTAAQACAGMPLNSTQGGSILK